MKTTNGAAHSLNGHGLNGHGLNDHGQNGHRSYGMNPVEAKTDTIISCIKANEGKLSLIAYVIMALLIGPVVYYDVTHSKPTLDPYSAIKTQIENIDLDQPKHDIRLELDEIKSAVEDLRPGYEPDPPTMHGT
jgi:hypothetical protein